jgi:RIO-like serine/threonine protein kinase
MFQANRTLKKDLFGSIRKGQWAPTGEAGREAVQRETRSSPLWIRALAAILARREAAALRRLAAGEGVPRLLFARGGTVVRSWIEGRPMSEAPPPSSEYFSEARRIVTSLHRVGVAHNDLAKEQNWIVTPEGRPALVDFQLAVRGRRGRVFRWMAREDLRHLLKHKRKYRPADLTDRERRLLAHPLPVTRFIRSTGKRLYNVVTRRVFRWTDSEGRGPRRPR